jgi:tripartite ATP-independent transporter DctM subunit
MMDPSVVGILGIILLLVLLVVGVHIGVALGLVGIIGSALIVGFEASVYSSVSNIYHKVASYELITIPLFILMGYMASGGGISEKTYKALSAWVGQIRGGIGISTVLACTAFGAVCGSSMVTAAVFARLCAPEMRKHGYEKKLSYGICAAGGAIGMLIPPSIVMVIYGVMAGESTGKLLIAGITPGLLLTVLFSTVIVIISRLKNSSIHPDDHPEVYTWKEKIKLLGNVWQVLLVAVVLFGGIFGGIFNPTEAAAVVTAVLMVLLVMSKWRGFWAIFKEAFRETGSTTAMIFLVMGSATVFSQFLVLTGITERIVLFVIGAELSPILFILLVVATYLLLGSLLDSISMLCITIPLFNPIVSQLGIDPIWYAVIVVLTIHAGLITPPVGLNVYATYAVAEKDVTLEEIFYGVLPFAIAMLVAIGIVICWPSLSTFLPELMLAK